MNGDEAPASDCGDRVNAPEKANPELTGLCDQGEVSARNSDVQRVVSFNEIAGGTTEVIIEHEGQKYRLRATRNGRLLLNK